MGTVGNTGSEPRPNTVRVVYVIQGGGKTSNGKQNGTGWGRDVMYTLNDVDVHAVCYENVIGVDLYNQQTTGVVAKSLTNKATDSDHIPCRNAEMTREEKSWA